MIGVLIIIFLLVFGASRWSLQRYEAAIARTVEYILAGDTMQVVLSQRMSLPFDA